MEKWAYEWLAEVYANTNKDMPVNKGAKRDLDCAVIKCALETNEKKGIQPYDTVRSAFLEGHALYEGSNFTDRLHVELCVINKELIKGYFLPRPIDWFNPNLKKAAA
jgi:hypothetical protein